MSTENTSFDYIECINLIKQLFPKSCDNEITQNTSVRQRLIHWATQAFEKSTLENDKDITNNNSQLSPTFKDILFIISEENKKENQRTYTKGNNKKEAAEHKKSLLALLEIVILYYRNNFNKEEHLNQPNSSEALLSPEPPEIIEHSQQSDGSSTRKTDIIEQKTSHKNTPEPCGLLPLSKETRQLDTNTNPLSHENKNTDTEYNYTENSVIENQPLYLIRGGLKPEEHRFNINNPILNEDDEIDFILHQLFIEE